MTSFLTIPSPQIKTIYSYDPIEALYRSLVAGPVFIDSKYPTSAISRLGDVFRQNSRAADQAINKSLTKATSTLGDERSSYSTTDYSRMDSFIRWYARNCDFLFCGKTIRACSQELPYPANNRISVLVSRIPSLACMDVERARPHSHHQ